MNLLNALQLENTVYNTKGGKYYASSYSANLDFFSGVSRWNTANQIRSLFNNALNEDVNLALANLLYVLDIRGGKGERRLFKKCFVNLCNNNKELALKILPLIPLLGRFDYVLWGLYTQIEDEVVALVKNQLEEDLKSDTPSLLGKWLPSLRTHNKNNKEAKYLVKKLGISEKEYRKILSLLRSKINIVEKNITNKTLDNINFSYVPSKAMLKYKNYFNSNMKEEYTKYLNSLVKGETKVNTTGLFAYEIIKAVWKNKNGDDSLFDAMWNSQKDVLKGQNKNVLVVADTSGSMTCCNSIPLASSIGLALYTAERNTGIFKDTFITFSNRPTLQQVKGKTIKEKLAGIKTIVSNTDIDKVFKLILDASVKNKISQSEMPSHILIISDMEFDDGVYSKGGTNFNGWKEAFKLAGYNLPSVIFWNVATYTRGLPVAKQDNDVVMISGFSTNVLENIFDLNNYNPVDYMMSCLERYIKMLK